MRTVELHVTAEELQALTAAMAGNQPPSLAHTRVELLRKLARAGREVDMPPRTCTCGAVSRCIRDGGDAACPYYGFVDNGAYRTVTLTQEGEYARNQQEAVEHIRTLPPSERSAVANRPGQAPPSTQQRESGEDRT